MSGGPALSIEGRLEGVEGQFVCGWAWSPNAPEDRLTVTVHLGSRCVAFGVADLPRPSLVREGIGDGAYGFRIWLPEDVLADAGDLSSLVALAGVGDDRLHHSTAFPGTLAPPRSPLPPSPAVSVSRPPGRTVPRLARHDVAVAARHLPLVLLSLAGVTLVWSRVLATGQGMTQDELYSVINYITPGPSGIWSHYVPNDHMLYELESWVTVTVTGLHGNDTYRLWSILPGVGAVVLMSSWLARRFDWWCGAIFAALATTSPVELTLSTQARGYGLGFLAGALLVIGIAEFTGPRARRGRIVFTAGALIGVWTLPVFIVPVILVAAIALCFGAPRRPTVMIVAGVGFASLVFYAPVLSELITSTSQKFGTQLPWYGFVSAPLFDQVVPNLSLLSGATSREYPASIANVSYSHVGSAIAMFAAMAAGSLALIRRGDQRLAAVLGITPFASYLVYEATRVYVEPRFGSFLLVPMLALVAIGLVATGRLVARVLPAAHLGVALAAAAALIVSAVACVKIERMAEQESRVGGADAAAAILAGTQFTEPIITNTSRPLGLDYYLGARRFRVIGGAELAGRLCGSGPPFIYVEFAAPPPPRCLQKHALAHVVVPELSPFALTIWFVR